MSTVVESLEVEVQSSATSAVSGLDALASSLSKIKTAVKGGIGLTAVSKQLTTLNTALSSVNGENATNLNKLAQGLQTLSACGNLKLSSSVATQITSIGGAVRSLGGTDFGSLASLASALTPLANVGKSNLNSFISQLQRLPEAVRALASVDMAGLGANLTQLVSALAPLSQMGKNNLTSFITQLSKLPQLMASLKTVDIGTLTAQIQQLANAFAPLGEQMQKISAGFTAFPARIQRLITSTDKLTHSNNRASTSYVNLAAKVAVAVTAVRTISRVIASWITKSNEYIENLNLFNASMGQYAAEAQAYAEKVGDIIGIDPGEWMRNQGIFMTMASGFGVAGDRAVVMSQNLTQLGYDLSSLYNMSHEDALQKLQSGLAGELEPLRRLGYDLSVARLQQEAYTLGITKKVSAMTQAEKAELRYYAIMTQVTTAQGDMARTLDAPANQLRILKAQVNQCARALGNIFIPALNAILPYAIAVAKVIRIVADSIAALFNFKLPEVDYSGIGNVVGGIADGVEDVENGIGDATKEAKKLKNALLGIDELNIISRETPDLGSGVGNGAVEGGGAGGGLGFELPAYDFLGDALKSRAQEIIDKWKEWLGLNKEIASWADFMDTRLFDILAVVGAITGALAGWKVLSLLKKFGVSIGLSKVLGIVLAIAGAIEFVLQYWNAWTNGVDFGNFIGLVAGAAGVIGGLALAFGPIGAAIGAAVTGIGLFVLGIKDAIENGLSLLNGIMIPLGATLTGAGIGALIGALGGPIGAGIGALIGLAVGLIVDFSIWLYQNWDDVCTYFDGVMLNIQNFFKTSWNNVVSFAKGIPNKIIGAFHSLDRWVKEIPTKFKAKLDAIGAHLDALPNKIKTWFTNMQSKIKTWFSDLWEPIQNFDWGKLGSDIGKWFGTAVKDAYDFVTKTVPQWFSDTGNAIKDGFKTFFTSTLPTFFTETIPQVVQSVADFFKELPTRIGNIITAAWDGIVGVGKSIVDGIVEGLQTVWQAIKDFVNGFIQGFKDALGIKSPSTVFKEIGGFLVDGLMAGISGFTAMAGKVKEWAASVVEWFTKGEDGKGIIENFKETAGSIVGGFKDKIGSAYNTVKSNVTTWASSVKDWFSNSSFGGINQNTFSNFANNTIEGFKAKIGSAYTTVRDNVTKWASDVKNTFEGSGNTSLVSKFGTFAGNVIDGFKDKIGSYYTEARDNIKTWASDIKSTFEGKGNNSLFESFKNIAKNVVNGFSGGIIDFVKSSIDTVKSWAGNLVKAVKDLLGIKSPSRVFYSMGENTVLGYNNAIKDLGGSTMGLVTKWTDSFTNVAPSMKLAVDTSALKYYDSSSFAKSISANVTSNNSVTAVGFKEAMEEFYKEYVEPTMAQMAEDMHKQADKNEQTIVQVGGRTITDAVTTQKKANGYQFVTT